MEVRERSAGMVVVADAPRHCRFLILRAYRNWDFPKGLVQPGESALAAARRELAEETGLGTVDMPWGTVWRETEPYGRGKVARYYVAASPALELELPVSPELGRPEHHEYRWVSTAGARRLLNARLRGILEWAAGVAGCGDGPR